MDISLLFFEPWYVWPSCTCPPREYVLSDFEGDGACVSGGEILLTTTPRCRLIPHQQAFDRHSY